MPIRYLKRRIKRFFVYRVLSLDDTPHRIALGVAVGIFITWTPTIGLQMLLTVLLAMLLRANKFVGVPFVWISNPITALIIYPLNYQLGWSLLRGPHRLSEFLGRLTDVFSFGGGWIAKTQAFWKATWQFFGPLWLGSILMGLALGALSYFLTYRAVVGFRHQLEHHRHVREERAASRGDDLSSGGDSPA